MAEKQWVNLPKKTEYEESGVTKDRLGPVVMELEFKKTDPPMPWKVKATAEGDDNIEYSRKEQGRNKQFKLRNFISFGVSDSSSVMLENSVYLPAAGGNTYKIEAQDSNGKTVGSPLTLETRRKLYYQVICMKGIPAMPTGDMEKEFWNPTKKYFLKLDAPEAAGEMKYYKNIKDDWDDPAGRVDMFRQATVDYKLKDLHPFAIVIACSNQCGSPADFKFRYSFRLWGKAFAKNDAELEIPLPDNLSLWYDFDDIDDAQKGNKGIWLRNRVVFADGKSAFPLDWNNAVLGPKSGKLYQKIKVTIPKDMRHKVFSRKCTLLLKVKVADGFACGYSDPEANFITVCQEAWQEKIDDGERMQTLVHELGHKVGMVPEGKGVAPASPPHLYGHVDTGSGAGDPTHSGNHCAVGIKYNATTETWKGKPGCVMFGADSGGGHASPATFCSDCDEAMRKMDLDARVLPNFQKFITAY